MTYANAWVRAVDGARRRTPGAAALAIAVGVLALGLFGGPVVYRLLAPAPPGLGPNLAPGPHPGADGGLGGGYLMLVLDRLLQFTCVLGPLYVAAVGMGVAYERRAAVARPVGRVASGLGGAGLGMGFFLVALGLAAALHAVRPGAAPQGAAHRLVGAAAGAALILFQAGAEEGFFRGWLQPVLAARWGPWIGLGVVSLLFAGAHAVARPLAPVAFVNDALAGLGFGLLALRTGGLAAPLAAHWGWNWVEACVVGATPNPGVDPLGSLFDLDLAGPALIAGGADEMNGSLCATAALCGLIACAALWRPRRV